jgi:hypothetical protein
VARAVAAALDRFRFPFKNLQAAADFLHFALANNLSVGYYLFMLNNTQHLLNINRKAQRKLRNAYLHVANQYDAETGAVFSRAMDRVDNERMALRRRRSAEDKNCTEHDWKLAEGGIAYCGICGFKPANQEGY